MAYQIKSTKGTWVIYLPQLYLSAKVAEADVATLQQLFPHITYEVVDAI